MSPAQQVQQWARPTHDNPVPAGSVADAFEPRIAALLPAYPPLASTVIAERIRWPYSIRTLNSTEPAFVRSRSEGPSCYSHSHWFPIEGGALPYAWKFCIEGG